MTLEMDRIVVGERYRLVIRPNLEYVCPTCHGVLGLHEQSMKLDGQIVTVIGDASGGLSRCGQCGFHSRDAEGLYVIDLRGADGGFYVVPYNWLQPEDAPYEPAQAYVMGVDPGIGTTIEVQTP